MNKPNYLDQIELRISQLKAEIETLQGVLDFYRHGINNTPQASAATYRHGSGETTMNKVLTLAEELIRSLNRPITLIELTRAAIERGYFEGKQPDKIRRNVAAILSNDRKKQMRLVSIGDGKYEINDSGVK